MMMIHHKKTRAGHCRRTRSCCCGPSSADTSQLCVSTVVCSTRLAALAKKRRSCDRSTPSSRALAHPRSRRPPGAGPAPPRPDLAPRSERSKSGATRLAPIHAPTVRCLSWNPHASLTSTACLSPTGAHFWLHRQTDTTPAHRPARSPHASWTRSSVASAAPLVSRSARARPLAGRRQRPRSSHSRRRPRPRWHRRGAWMPPRGPTAARRCGWAPARAATSLSVRRGRR